MAVAEWLWLQPRNDSIHADRPDGALQNEATSDALSESRKSRNCCGCSLVTIPPMLIAQMARFKTRQRVMLSENPGSLGMAVAAAS